MNLLDIILNYLEKDENDADAYLNDLVKNADMDKRLIKHIKGCRENSKVIHQGSYLSTDYKPGSDVNVWTVKSFWE